MSAKVALIVIVPVLPIVSFFSYNHYLDDRAGILRNAQMQLQTVGQSIVVSAESLIKKNQFDIVQEIVTDAVRREGITRIAVITSRGALAVSSDKELLGKEYNKLFPAAMTEIDIQAVRKALAGEHSIYYDPHDSQYCLVMPISFGDSTGAVYTCLDITNTEAEISKHMVENLVILILATFVIAITIYFLFHYLFTKRIQAVSNAAVTLAQGNTNIRVKDGGTDEIGYLAESFNVLVEDIKNWRNNLEEMVSSRVIELSALYEVADIISRSLELKTILPEILDHVLETLGERKGVITLTDDERSAVTVLAHRGLSADSLQLISWTGQGNVGDVLLKNEPVRIGSSDQGPDSVPWFEQENILSVLAVPLTVSGAVLGVLAVFSPRSERFSEEDEALLSVIGNQTGVAIQNARLYERTLELAREDSLTKLANRRHLMELLQQEIARAVRYNTALSVIIMDLDLFKRFNDSHGHLKGDELLKGFGSMVKSAIRNTDIAGRYGGEEFAVILPNTSLNGATVIAERIRKATEQLTIPLDDGSPAGTTISIGIAELGEGQDEQKLLEAADTALYRAKEAGRNRVAW